MAEQTMKVSSTGAEPHPTRTGLENQKAPIYGEPDFSYPKGRTVIPHCPAPGMWPDWFCPQPPMPPCSCSLWVLPRVAFSGPKQLQELPAQSLQLHQAGLSGRQESFELTYVGISAQETTGVGLGAVPPCTKPPGTHPLPGAVCAR